jgi:hypothetical protein
MIDSGGRGLLAPQAFAPARRVPPSGTLRYLPSWLEQFGLVNGQSFKIGVAGIEQEISLTWNQRTR